MHLIFKIILKLSHSKICPTFLLFWQSLFWAFSEKSCLFQFFKSKSKKNWPPKFQEHAASVSQALQTYCSLFFLWQTRFFVSDKHAWRRHLAMSVLLISYQGTYWINYRGVVSGDMDTCSPPAHKASAGVK